MFSRIVVSRDIPNRNTSNKGLFETKISIKKRAVFTSRQPKSSNDKEKDLPPSSIKSRLGWQDNDGRKSQTCAAVRSEDSRSGRKSQIEMDEKMRQMKEYNEKVKRRRKEIQKEIDELSS